MSHLDADEVLDAARRQHAGARVDAAEHLRECARCRDGVTAMVRLVAAGEVLADEEARDLVVPPFERVRAALPPQAVPHGSGPLRSAEAHRSPWELLRLVAALVWAQLSLLPRFLGPTSVLGFVGAVLLAVWLPESSPGLREHAFGAAVVLIVLIGALTTYSGGRDPRFELLCSLPISPPTVFLCRVVAVLGLDVLLAVLSSAAAEAFGGGPSLSALLASWFGQALLTAGVALVGAVAHAPVTGTLAGVLVWMLGTSSGLPVVGQLLPARAVFAVLWTSSPAVLAFSLVLLVVAVLGMRRPRLGSTEPNRW